MQFRTELIPDKLPFAMQLTDQIVTVGSCFAEVMGQRLADNKLVTSVNPLGTLFNPISINKLLTLALTNGAPDEASYAQRDGLWLHYDFHSSFWAITRSELTNKLLTKLAEVKQALRRANWLLLTLWRVYLTVLECERIDPLVPNLGRSSRPKILKPCWR